MSPKETDQGAAPLSELCLGHAHHEEAVLEAMAAGLRRVRAALVSGDARGLSEAAGRQEELVTANSALSQQRQRFRQAAAARLAVPPESVTLQFLASRLNGETARALTASRERLRRLAAEVEQLNQNNVVLLYYCLEFLDRFFMELTGRESSSTRYGPTGAYQGAACGAIIEARG